MIEAPNPIGSAKDIVVAVQKVLDDTPTPGAGAWLDYVILCKGWNRICAHWNTMSGTCEPVMYAVPSKVAYDAIGVWAAPAIDVLTTAEKAATGGRMVTFTDCAGWYAIYVGWQNAGTDPVNLVVTVS